MDKHATKPSQLRPPSKVQVPAAGLSELSASDNNVRSLAMPPPAMMNGIKHRPANLHEPEPKRKTLMERAGEPYRTIPAGPVSKQPRTAQPTQRMPFSQSVSRMPPNASSRPPTSFANGHGQSGIGRPGNPRSQSALGHSRSQSYNSFARPGTAIGTRNNALAQSVQADGPPSAWEDPAAVSKRLEGMTEMMEKMASQMEGTTFEKKGMAEVLELYKAKVAELEAIRNSLNRTVDELHKKLEEGKEELAVLKTLAHQAQRDHEIETDDLERKHRHDLTDIRGAHKQEIDQLRRDANTNDESLRKEMREQIAELIREHKDKIDDLERQLRKDLDEERSRRIQEVAELTTQRDLQLQDVAADIGKKEREASSVRDELRQIEADFEKERTLRSNIEAKLHEASINTLSLESANRAMKAKIDFLQSNSQEQSQAFADLHKRTQEAIEAAALANEKLRSEETLRRKLHNQVQELKGNIRVFARVRPTLGEEEEAAEISFPNHEDESNELVVKGPETKSALGKTQSQMYNYSFDRVFDPSAGNSGIFEEISQLVQSALDGYNVCIFCYGQTGSGKTFTMSAADGMIPRAVRQIYETAQGLEEKGWKYRMEGSFVEVYNEELNDLLGKAEDLDKKKHEIRHDTVNCKTTVTGVEKVELDSPERVQEMLKRADKNRSVAATKANSRSSRSHSVFILTLVGENSLTGEKSEGTLNLVDLAGSERLSHSKAEGDRLKETQNINKSLSCLGDVIGALGKKEGGHVPYRNSKLTHLLQYSLGGNSKTLMFVMISPLQAHLSETITSLKFATKVYNTHIGTAKKQTKVGH